MFYCSWWPLVRYYFGVENGFVSSSFRVVYCRVSPNWAYLTWALTWSDLRRNWADLNSTWSLLSCSVSTGKLWWSLVASLASDPNSSLSAFPCPEWGYSPVSFFNQNKQTTTLQQTTSHQIYIKSSSSYLNAKLWDFGSLSSEYLGRYAHWLDLGPRFLPRNHFQHDYPMTLWVAAIII